MTLYLLLKLWGKNAQICAWEFFSKGEEVNIQPAETIEVTVDHHTHCRALGAVLDRIGNKWTVMVVGVLSGGALRFNQIMRAIGGVSHRMLTLTLRGLERDGLVTRRAYAEVPPRVEYELTDLGRSLMVPLKELAAWGQVHQGLIERARQDFDDRQGS